MASKRLEDLCPEMQDKAQQIIQICADNGVELLIYCTLRSLEEQAGLYMSSRTPQEIAAKQQRLRNLGFGFIADIFDNVTPPKGKIGKHVTNAGPGESFHNYAEAFDAVPLVHGKAQWEDPDPTVDEWGIYGQAVRDVGCNWAGDWRSFKEFPHAQLRTGGNPLKEYTAQQVYDILTQNGLLKS